jgi:hypothetical protein
VDSISAVDRAELEALLDRISREEGSRQGEGSWGGPRGGVARSIFCSDLLQVGASLAAGAAPGEKWRKLASGMIEAAKAAGAGLSEEAAAPEAQPPPLRSGEWLEAAPPTSPGLLSSKRDLRWTRVARERDPPGSAPHAVLVRLRVAVDPAGRPLLLPLASECWELEGTSGGGTVPRVWRFDREAWVQGREPWRKLEGSAEIALRDPEDKALAGGLEGICLSCHAGRKPEGPAPEDKPYEPVLQEKRRETYRPRVLESLRDLLERK